MKANETKIITLMAAIIAAVFLTVSTVSCSGKKCSCQPCTCQQPCKCSGANCGDGNCCTPSCGVDSTKMPLNVSVFIDLSDRLIHDADGTTQVNKDTCIINHIASLVSEHAWKGNIKLAKDRFKVFFYPAPTDPTINNLSRNMNIDLSEFSKGALQEKMQKTDDMANIINKNLKVIYDKATKEANFVGCDIWGFFNNKVKSYCVAPERGYRNILIVLTDGYIYHENNLTADNSGRTTYIAPKTLASGAALIPCSTKLNDLEVLFLEVNANPMTDGSKIQSTIGNWLKSMDVKKFQVEETDLPSNTKTIIDNFFNIHK